jgi:hypothetical protein
MIRKKRKEYQLRPSWVSDRAWDRGYIEAFEIVRIAAWKSAISAAAITVNKPEDIEDCTRAAISIIRPWRGRKKDELASNVGMPAWRQAANDAIGWNDRKGSSCGLLSLKGVRYPMATAILDILDPSVWPVIDKWAAKTVFGTVPAHYCAARYAAYARHLAIEGAARWGAELSIHQFDEEAQLASMPGGQLPDGWPHAALPECTCGITG